MGFATSDFKSLRIDEMPIGVRFGLVIVSGLDRVSNGYVLYNIEDAEVICDVGGEKRIYGTDAGKNSRFWRFLFIQLPAGLEGGVP